MLERISRTPVVEEVLTILKKKIETMTVDEKLPPENRLVEELGVSRQTVREVLITLQAEGFIEIKRGKGAFIRDKDKVDRQRFMEWFRNNEFKIQELLEIRMAIEPYVAQLAATKITDEEFKELEKTYKEFEKTLELNNIDEIVKADENFHEMILKISKNEGLKFIYDQFIPSLREYRSRVFSPPADPFIALHHHKIILEALGNRDPLAAYQNMMEHILDSKDDVNRIATSLGIK